MPRFCTDKRMADASCEAGTKKRSEIYLRQGPRREICITKYNKSDVRSNSTGQER